MKKILVIMLLSLFLNNCATERPPGEKKGSIFLK